MNYYKMFITAILAISIATLGGVFYTASQIETTDELRKKLKKKRAELSNARTELKEARSQLEQLQAKKNAWQRKAEVSTRELRASMNNKAKVNDRADTGSNTVIRAAGYTRPAMKYVRSFF